MFGSLSLSEAAEVADDPEVNVKADRFILCGYFLKLTFSFLLILHFPDHSTGDCHVVQLKLRHI